MSSQFSPPSDPRAPGNPDNPAVNASPLLPEESRLLRLLIDHSNDAIEVVDPYSLRFLDVNTKACTALGYTRNEVLALSVFDIDPELNDESMVKTRDALRQNGAIVRETVHRRKDGSTFPVEVNIKIVRVERDYAITVVRDITERKHAEIALKQSEGRLKTLLELNNALVSKLAPEDLFPGISIAIQGVFHQDFAAICIYEHETQSMRLHALDLPAGEGLVGMALPINQSLAGQAFTTNAVQVYDRSDIEALPHAAAARALAHGIQSMCCIPLKGVKGTIGVLLVSSRQALAFEHLDFQFASLVAAQVAIALENARAYRNIEQLNAKLNDEKTYVESELQSALHLDEIIGDSPALAKVLEDIKRIAGTDSNVLITGETGTGKELVARAIHKLSSRSKQAFIKMNCAAVPSGLLESELFGHEKGAFTSAISRKLGRLELADGGTLFLDEVGELPLELQPKLLRVLQDQEFERLGSNRTIRSNMRLISATNCDLQQCMREGTFRTDLFYRLNVFPVRLPSLRERRSDIPKLVSYFVAKYAGRMKKDIESVPTHAIEAMTHWDWPGNIRELENFIERSVILTPGTTLQAPLSELEARPKVAPQGTLQDLEHDYILRVLRESRGLIAGPTGAAARLGMKRTTLQSKLSRLGISVRDYRRPGDRSN